MRPSADRGRGEGARATSRRSEAARWFLGRVEEAGPAVRAAVRRIREDNILLLAAGVAFYGFLAIFPLLISAALVYGLVAEPEDVDRHLDTVAEALPDDAEELVTDQLREIAATSQRAVGVGLGASLIVGLWTISTGMKGLVVATNLAYERRETRSFLRLRIVASILALGAVAFVLVAALLVAAVPAVADAASIGTAGRVVAELIRWPLLVGLVMIGLAIIYRFGPDRDVAAFHLLSMGAVIGGLIWLVADLGFSLYVDNFSRYDNTYGSLAGVVVLMLWMYVSAFIVLMGAEINAEAERFEQQTATSHRYGEKDRRRGRRRRG